MSAEAEVKLRTLQFEYRMMERERLKTKALLGEALWALRACLESFGQAHAHKRIDGKAAHPDGSIKCACDVARAVLAKADK